MLAAGKSIAPFWALYAAHSHRDVQELLEEHRIGNLDESDMKVPYACALCAARMCMGVWAYIYVCVCVYLCMRMCTLPSCIRRREDVAHTRWLPSPRPSLVKNGVCTHVCTSATT